VKRDRLNPCTFARQCQLQMLSHKIPLAIFFFLKMTLLGRVLLEKQTASQQVAQNSCPFMKPESSLSFGQESAIDPAPKLDEAYLHHCKIFLSNPF
jgi:hypothetical protein